MQIIIIYKNQLYCQLEGESNKNDLILFAQKYSKQFYFSKEMNHCQQM